MFVYHNSKLHNLGVYSAN